MMTYDKHPTIKIILGKPAFTNAELDLETLDLGMPEQLARPDGSTVEVPNQQYVHKITAAFGAIRRF